MNSSASQPLARRFSFRRHGRTGKKSHMISALNLGASTPSLSARGLRACRLRITNVGPETISRPKLGVRTQAVASKIIHFEDGTCVRYVGSREETEFLYQEVFVEQQYLQHGVTLGRGDTVLDIGANIGLFTLFAAQRCPAGVVLAFEPIPFIFEALRQNSAALSDQPPSAGKAEVKCFNAGIADGTSNEAEFTYYRNAAGWSTFRPDESEVRRAMDVYLDSLLSSPAPPSPLLAVMKSVPSWLFKAAGKVFVDRKLAGKVQVTCKLLSISEVLEQEEIESVDLLKIDVERAEKEVLQGILLSDWPKIRQVAMEVHDVQGGLQTVVSRIAESLTTRKEKGRYGDQVSLD